MTEATKHTNIPRTRHPASSFYSLEREVLLFACLAFSWGHQCSFLKCLLGGIIRGILIQHLLINSRASYFLGLWASPVRHTPPGVVVHGRANPQDFKCCEAVHRTSVHFFMCTFYAQVDYKGMLKMSANEWATNVLVLLIEMHFQIL